MKINRKLLPIKAHFFFFMCAMGPILPQLSVFGKELGISTVVMGSVTGILPFMFLIAKPLFGMLVDVYRDYRKTIFMALIIVMTLSYALMNFIPGRPIWKLKFDKIEPTFLEPCNSTEIFEEEMCLNNTARSVCKSNCFEHTYKFLGLREEIDNVTTYRICSLDNVTHLELSPNCTLNCEEDLHVSGNACLYKSLTFWSFVVLMSIGTIGFNVVNSISDAICCDVIGEQYDYGKQRVWGTIGFGLSAVIAGYVVNLCSDTQISYTPAFLVMLICSILDMISCAKLELPIIESPKNIFSDVKKLLNNRHVLVFIIFAVCCGIMDSVLVYFLFWYVEDLAKVTNTGNIKLIEGLIVAAETLGGEVIFFSISGKILERFGHVHCFSMCFLNYALRLGLISVAPSPWWILPVEFCLQGPSYAMAYTSIVSYANDLATPGTSATMQGIAAGMDDGVGYALGSILGGLLFEWIGGSHTLQVFSFIAVMCAIIHTLIHKTILKTPMKVLVVEGDANGIYKDPEEAYKDTYDPIT